MGYRRRRRYRYAITLPVQSKNNMKRSLHLLFIGMLLAGCTSGIPCGEEPFPVPLVPLGLSDVQVTGSVFTRAGTVPVTDGNLGIFVSNTSGYTPAPYRYTGKAGSWSSANPLYLGPGIATICGWYPYEYYVPASLATLSQFTLKIQWNTPLNDLLFFAAFSGASNRNPQQSIRLKHAHAVLNFIISRDVTYHGPGKITAFTLASDFKVLSEARIDIWNGSFSGVKIVKSFTLELDKTLSAGDTDTLSVLIPPYTLESTTVKMSIDGKEVNGWIQGPIRLGESGKAAVIHVKLRSDLPLSIQVLPPDSATGEITW